MKRGMLVALTATFVGACVDMEDEEVWAEENVDSRSLQFFSQRDPAWADEKLGNCADETIGSAGCALASVAMAMTSLGIQTDPKTLNDYLVETKGYEGCLIKWAQAAEIDGHAGVQWIHPGVLGSPEALRAGLDQGKRVIAESTRYDPHWIYIVAYDGAGTAWSDFYYLDPYDLIPTHRRIGDGLVMPGAKTRVYR